MSTTTALPTPLRGDVCPPWCVLDRVDRGHTSPPADHGVFHDSAPVDEWVPVDGDKNITVYVSGYRHDYPEVTPDWPDTIWAMGDVNPGCEGNVALMPGDAKRLGDALLAACDLMEARS